jgi:hypothetical protein
MQSRIEIATFNAPTVCGASGAERIECGLWGAGPGKKVDELDGQQSRREPKPPSHQPRAEPGFE